MDNGSRKVTLFRYSQTGNSFACAERAAALLEKNGYQATISYMLNPAEGS